MSNASHSALPYRSDIDGLRAVAVLSVVLYHFGLPVQGGFVGVDVFFVISGFLIGGILWREYDSTGRVSLLAFYIRRFRRLAPAFFAMALFTTLAAFALMLPFEFREYGKTLIAATVFLSNVLFYRSAGYFDAASEDKPLLHTWSLAVEEQFYIFLPLFILLFARWRFGLVGGLVVIWAASLVACVMLTPTQAEAAFYLFPFRAWEMLTGVLIAIWGHSRRATWQGHAVWSWLGIVLIAISIALIPSGPHFPGLLALFPVAGTALLLANGRGYNLVNRVLCNRILVFFGLISYSLYLWHWPVFTLSSYLRDGYAHMGEAVVWMAVSCVLAYLSWRFVEQPVRRARGLSGGMVLGGALVSSAILLALGGFVFVRDGLPGRFGPDAHVHIAASGDFLQDWSRCRTETDGPLAGLEQCPIGPDGPPRVLIWGDSHLRAMKEGLDLAAHEANMPAVILWRAGCAPLFGLQKTETSATAAQNAACTTANQQIKAALPQLSTIDTVLLIGRWAYYTTGSGTGLDAQNRITIAPAEGSTTLGQAQVFTQAAADTIAQMSNVTQRLFVLRQPPEIPQYDSRQAAREAAHNGWPLAAAPTTQTDVVQSSLALRAALADAPWRPLADSGAITLIDPWPALCDATKCTAIYQGTGQYFDNNHLTNSAALRLRDLFAPVFLGAQQTALRDP